MQTTPTIGRTVGYVFPGWHSHAGQVAAAVITRVGAAGVVSLHVFSPPNCYAVTDHDTETVAHDAGGKMAHTWHWLPRTQ